MIVDAAYGCYLALTGKPGDAIPVLERAIERFPVSNTSLMARGYLATTHLGNDDAEAARAVAEGGAELGRARDAWPDTCMCEILRCRALTRLNASANEAAIEAGLADCDQLIELSGAHTFRPQVLEARAEWATARGNSEESGTLFREAIIAYREIGATGHAARLEQSD
jgi:hypothetical protein